MRFSPFVAWGDGDGEGVKGGFDCIRLGLGDGSGVRIVIPCRGCGEEIAAVVSGFPGTVRCGACGHAEDVSEPVLGAGVTLGGFRLEKQLGSGEQGEVWRAWQESMDRWVAVKVLAVRAADNPALLQRWRREVAAAAGVRHANVVALIDAGEDAGVHFLAMGLVDGVTLRDVMEAHGPLDAMGALMVLDRVAAALEAMWEQAGLVHRDVKPANVMVTRGREVKLLDLGCCLPTREAARVTRTGDWVGTPRYMSPEQVADAVGSVDHRSDQFALGRMGKELRDWGTDENGDAEADVREVLDRMAALDVGARFSDWAGARAALRACLLQRLPAGSGEGTLLETMPLPETVRVSLPAEASSASNALDVSGRTRRLSRWFMWAGLLVALGAGVWFGERWWSLRNAESRTLDFGSGVRMDLVRFEGPEAGGVFWMGKTEVAQNQFCSLVRRNPSHHVGEALPVEQVTWSEAMRWCERLNATGFGRPSGMVFRLPTAAEWAFVGGEASAGAVVDFPGRVGDGAVVNGVSELAGNVAEWGLPLDGDGGEDGLLPVFGGDWREARAGGAEPRVRERTSFDRWTGFRVVLGRELTTE